MAMRNALMDEWMTLNAPNTYAHGDDPHAHEEARNRVPACQTCNADNPVDARFCSSCGTPLAVVCPGCGAQASGRFCSQCGTSLSGPAPAAAPVRTTTAQPVAERRITSVLFGDLAGFTPLSE